MIHMPQTMDPMAFLVTCLVVAMVCSLLAGYLVHRFIDMPVTRWLTRALVRQQAAILPAR